MCLWELIVCEHCSESCAVQMFRWFAIKFPFELPFFVVSHSRRFAANNTQPNEFNSNRELSSVCERGERESRIEQSWLFIFPCDAWPLALCQASSYRISCLISIDVLFSFSFVHIVRVVAGCMAVVTGWLRLLLDDSFDRCAYMHVNSFSLHWKLKEKKRKTKIHNDKKNTNRNPVLCCVCVVFVQPR